MERSAFIKTVTFAVLHFGVAFAVGYLLTGDLLVGGLIAIVEPLCNTVVFYFHERVWSVFKNRRLVAAS